MNHLWPTVVVLDTERIMGLFRKHCEMQGKPYDLPDDMADEIIACFKRQSNAEIRFDEFVTSIISGDYQYPYGDYIDTEVTSFIMELGDVMLEQILSHCLYDEHGMLNYRHTAAREKQFNCVILRRIAREHYAAPQHHRVTAQRSF